MTPALFERQSTATSVLVVDDDNDIRTLLGDFLSGAGFEVLMANDGTEMHRHLASRPVDLIVLDLNLKQEDGLALCRELRSGSSTPVIMLTARADPIDRIIGLELGADDYVTKPFEPRELVARIRTVLRRTAPPRVVQNKRSTEALFDGWTLDFEQRHLIDPEGALVMLSGVEYTLLRVMVEHAHQVLSREQIISICNARGISGRAIDLQISRVRHKLRDEVRASSLIKTVRGEGYVFAARVEFQ